MNGLLHIIIFVTLLNILVVGEYKLLLSLWLCDRQCSPIGLSTPQIHVVCLCDRDFYLEI